MSSFGRRPPVPGDAAGVAELVIAYERSLYGKTEYSLGDLEAEWEALDLARDALVFLDGERVVAFGSLDDRGELCRIDAYVHPEERGRGLGTELVAALEAAAASRGVRRIQYGVVEPDEAGHRLLAGLGYRLVRVFRELRIDLDVGRALLRDAFRKFRDRGEPSVGLSVDAENVTGAFRLYESAGMRPVMGWVMHEKDLGG